MAGFSGSHRYVLDYLTDEVLDRQPQQLRSFLLETSILDRLSGELCEAVTGRADSQLLLETVERANLFLVPLDEVRGWWRYHHLFADLLQARLRQERPERVPELHRAAAAWCERHGLVDEAIGHARGAGDGTWAAGLVEQHFEAGLGWGEDATLRSWLETLPVEAVRSRPRLCLAQAFWRSSAAAWRRRSGCWTPPSDRSRPRAMNRTTRRSAGPRACWGTSQRRSPEYAPPLPICAAILSRRSPSRGRPWLSWATANGC